MTTKSAGLGIGQLLRVLRAHDAEGRTDGQLLERFLVRRDEAAFAALVRRHGPMVFGVCRRILGNEADSEDAFQATFLVLVRKAPSLTSRSVLGDWLHGVARHTALKAKAAATHRRAKEQAMARPDATAEARNDWLPVLDEELARLPEKYRLPIVLCDLEGKTRQEAAAQLGWPEGTVAGRLARGRTLLAKALARHGVVFSGGALAVALSQNTASACVSGSLVFATVKAASMSAAGKAVAGVVSAKVAALADGVMKTMFLTKLKTVTATLLIVGMSAFGAGSLVHHTAAGQQSKAEENADKPANRQAAAKETPSPVNQPKVDDVKPRAEVAEPIHLLSGHKDRIRSVAYSADGECIASAGWDGTVRLWDPKTGKEVRRLDVPPTSSYDPAYLSKVLFSPDSEFVVVAQQSMPNEPGVIVWNRRTGERVRDFPGQSAAIAPDGKHIACGGWGTPTPGIRLYEFATGKLVREIHSPYSGIDGLAYSRDGKMLFASVGIPRPPLKDGLQRLGHDPVEIRAWDVATGKERRTGLDEAGARSGNRITVSPDGRTFVLAASVRETATGGHRIGLIGHGALAVNMVAFSPDGRTLASAGNDGTVRVWDVLSGKELGRFGKEVDQTKGGWVLSVAFSPDGRTVVSGGLDIAKGGRIPSTAKIWDVSRITGRQRTVAERSPAELEADWKDLGGDAAKGYAAVGRLVSSPKQAVSFLGTQLQSATPPDSKRIERLIGDLDDARFQVREKAAKELEALGEFAVPFVQKALAGKPSLEGRRRLEAVLDQLEKASLSTETVRQIRAVEVLESIGNLEAVRLLDKLGAGPAEMRLTQEALASGRRLAKRSSDGR